MLVEIKGKSAWSFLGGLLAQVQNPATVVGKVQLTVPLVFRILLVTLIAREQRVAVEREYLLGRLQKLASRGALQRPSLRCLGSSQFLKGQLLVGERILPKGLGAVDRKPSLRSHRGLAIYIAHVVLRAFMELAFLVGQYYLFGFDVPYLFHHHSYPCPTSTNCFVSRATEKMIFLDFMFGVGVSCFLLKT
ncbi:gap junction alpha-3 protein-like [Eptesicus fuscus]|uniref:gap junction alpha-3 protein-like n=1 Tax=Eptesicus fuscus TaxID=29078 RepID=UPI002403D339|nr:gap junction alpha-3 protein-like [Eptesicus fuscus]